MEEWKDIDKMYEVSSYGRIRRKNIYVSHPYKNTFRIKHFYSKIKTLVPDENGYLRVKLYGKYYSVSHLVANAFIENKNGYSVIHHKDKNNQNNNIDNLEWISKEEHDAKHSVEKTKKVYQYSLDGKLIKIWTSTIECGRNGFCQGHVASCCRGERKTHKGYIWSYSPID